MVGRVSPQRTNALLCGGPAKLASPATKARCLRRASWQRALGVAAYDELLHAELPERRDLLGDEGREAGGRAVLAKLRGLGAARVRQQHGERHVEPGRRHRAPQLPHPSCAAAPPRCRRRHAAARRAVVAVGAPRRAAPAGARRPEGAQHRAAARRAWRRTRAGGSHGALRRHAVGIATTTWVRVRARVRVRVRVRARVSL